MTQLPRIILSRFDQERLEKLLTAVGPRPDLDALREEIERAEVVEPEAIPADRVTMNSRVRFIDDTTGKSHQVTLVFPGHADAEQDRISILAPIGSALLGLSIGDAIDWPMPTGQTRRIRVTEISYQPEAAGDPS